MADTNSKTNLIAEECTTNHNSRSYNEERPDENISDSKEEKDTQVENSIDMHCKLDKQENNDCRKDGENKKNGATQEQQSLLSKQTCTDETKTDYSKFQFETGENVADSSGPEDLLPPWRTCVVLCWAFVFTYSAFEAIQNLQSSLHAKGHLGVLSLAVMYLAVLLGSVISPLCARLVGHKNILLGSFLVHLCYTCFNFSPGWISLISVSAALGVAIAGMAMSQAVYIACISTSYIHYKKLPQSSFHSVMSLFSGLFFSSFRATQITGNLMSSGILLSAKYNESTLRDNACGAQVCSDFDDSAEFEQPSKKILYFLFGNYALCNIIGVLIIALFLPRLNSSDRTRPREETIYSIVQGHIGGCSSLMFNPKFVVLIPFFMAQPVMIMVLYTGYTKAFVTCTIGIQWIGYCMVLLGIASSISAVLSSYLARYTGRILQFVIGMGLDISTIVIMLIWVPDYKTSPSVLLIVPLLSGISQGILEPQMQVLIGIVFPKEQLPSAFAAMNGVKCLAFSLYLCVACAGCLYHGLILALALYLPAMLGYGYTELREWGRERDKTETA